MPYPGFEPGTSGTVAGFPDHCTSWSAPHFKQPLNGVSRNILYLKQQIFDSGTTVIVTKHAQRNRNIYQNTLGTTRGHIFQLG